MIQLVQRTQSLASLDGPLYALGLDIWAKLEWNEALPGKFVTAWMRLLLLSLYYLCLLCASQHYNWVFPIASRNVAETKDTDYSQLFAWSFGYGIIKYFISEGPCMTTLGSSGQPVWILDLSVFFCTVLQSWSASLSLISRKSISPCPGFLNREYGYFLMLIWVFN